MSDPVPERLTRRGPAGPIFHLLTAGRSEAHDLTRSFEGEPGSGRLARVVRGAKARTYQALFDECAAAWQFPEYFGENWAALNDCLSDLYYSSHRAILCVVTDADQLLADAPDSDALFAFLSLFNDEGSRNDVEASAVHVVLQTDPEAGSTLSDRLETAEVMFDRL